MNKKYIAILGAGIIGAGALILMGQPQTSQAGGAFGGGPSKKEEAIVGPVTETTTETVTETPGGLGDTIYNIVFPDPSFPDIPQAPITEPWWVKSPDPPSPSPSPSYSPPRTVSQILAPVATDPPAPFIIPPSKKAEAVEEVLSRGPSTGIDIIDRIQWGF